MTIENNCRVRPTHATVLLAGLALLCPMATSAHSLHPVYYPLGPLPVVIAVEAWPVLLLIPLALAATTLVLWLWARRLGFLGNLWRAVVLYLAARLGETGLFFLLKSLPLFQRAGWTSSALDNFVPLVLLLAGGLALAMPLGWWLYRWTSLSAGRVALAVGTSSLAGYLAALAGTLLLVMFRGY